MTVSVLTLTGCFWFLTLDLLYDMSYVMTYNNYCEYNYN